MQAHKSSLIKFDSQNSWKNKSAVKTGNDCSAKVKKMKTSCQVE